MIDVPVVIYSAPIPNEVSVPNSVINTAKTSMILPCHRLFASLTNGSKSEEMSGNRPHR